MITSTHNPIIQRIRSLLTDKKARNEQQAFVLEGVRLVEEAVHANWPLQYILYCETISARGRSLLEISAAMGVEIDEVNENVIASASGTENSQGILAVAEMGSLPEKPDPNFLLIADNIRDPGNLGTLLRTAAAAGVDQVILSPGTADPFNPKVVRSAMGAHFHIPIRSAAWEDIAGRYKTRMEFFVAEMESSTSLWEADFRKPLALIIGGEAEGASEAARRLANQTINIPMSGKTESLNAAIAAGIILFEVVRQRKT
ncbi:MAG: TrmH family RNA methyltransferase [Anaerolineaceae bacterium]